VAGGTRQVAGGFGRVGIDALAGAARPRECSAEGYGTTAEVPAPAGCGSLRAMRRRVLPALLLLFAACVPVTSGEPEPATDPVRIASGPDVEAALLAHVLARLLARDGLSAELVAYSDARDARQALELGAVDVRPGYTGEAWLETLGRPDPPGDPQASFFAVRDDDATRGIVWLRPRFVGGFDDPPANATFVFVVAGPPRVDADLVSTSQLATRLASRPGASLCVDGEFATRPDGLRAVLAAYSVRSDQPVLAATGMAAVRGVLGGDCIAALTTATDGAVWLAGLRPLVDDLQVFPAFVVAPQVQERALEQHPALRGALAPMATQMTTALLGGWNARVVAGVPLEQVAEEAAEELFRRAGRVPAEPPADAEG